MKVTINIKNESSAKKILNLLNEIPYIEVKKTGKIKKIKRLILPTEYDKPVKVASYIKFNREEIYEDRIH